MHNTSFHAFPLETTSSLLDVLPNPFKTQLFERPLVYIQVSGVVVKGKVVF